MEKILASVQDKLKYKKNLINMALKLEEEAQSLRKEALENIFSEELNQIQSEIFSSLDRIDILEKQMLLILNFYKLNSDSITPIYISSALYLENVGGISIATIEDELVFLTNKIKALFNILDSICMYIGHDYYLVDEKETFDFSSMELLFEKRYFYCCRYCGNVIILDERDENYKSNRDLLPTLSKLNRARRLGIYQRRFMFSDTKNCNLFPNNGYIKR